MHKRQNSVQCIMLGVDKEMEPISEKNLYARSRYRKVIIVHSFLLLIFNFVLFFGGSGFKHIFREMCVVLPPLTIFFLNLGDFGRQHWFISSLANIAVIANDSMVYLRLLQLNKSLSTLWAWSFGVILFIASILCVVSYYLPLVTLASAIH